MKSKKALRGKLLGLAIFLLLLAGFLWYAHLFYTTSPYFTVKKILLAGDKSTSSVDYSEIGKMAYGKNIFKLDLGEIGEYMLDNYRELKAIQIRRAFPDSILVVALLRKPVAQLREERYYPIDEECIVLSDVKDSPDKDLPVISGISVNLREAMGKKIGSKSLRQALILFKFIKESGILNNHILREINAGNIKSMSFTLDDGMEIRIGHEDYAKRLLSLKEILTDPKIWLSDIGYIDLRFGEPVIGPKWKR
ncbi:MAG: cell division protein FtsQ/DivIB [Candidatus Omnitrophica bacterium]|nr:cell division protein FtsQ/DivIB [Candidatus Omnitrophota bacterium]MBU4488631.1 cell division protein FtsQ/DivIB [Candidatus Omnitrophota bacterium]MCG2705890.1 cell division protein FtsQ/DivIB [Candidatus Omnitrophota bacterium]